MIELFGSEYELIEDYREGFDAEALEARYSEVIKKNDFIVGDWGQSQLRLKRFYDEKDRKVCNEMIELFGSKYELIEDYREGFDAEALEARYSEVLKKYDFIVGDWGHSQLRLKGFYDENNRKAAYESRINMLDDYLLEYCNFGCAYFVLKKITEK